MTRVLVATRNPGKIREFALALIVGMISGVFSSIMVATPLLA